VRRTLGICAALICLVAAIRLPLLDLPFERDEGEYAYIAWRLGHGELPYRDWVDQKPPAIFWVYRLALALPLEDVVAVHLVGAAFAAATAVALFFLARRFTSDGWAGVAAATFALLSADPIAQGAAANTELFMLLPLVLAQIAFLRAAGDQAARTRWSVLCGVLVGGAVAFKQVAAVQALVLVALWPLFARGDRRLRDALVFAARLGLGAALVWVPIALYFFAHDGLGALVFEVFTHNFAYAGALPGGLRARALLVALVTLSGAQLVVWIAAAIGLATLARAGRSHELAFLAGSLVAGIVGASASGYYFLHYFQQLLPPLAIAAALGAERLGGADRLRAATATAFLLAPPALSIAPFLRLSPADAVRRIYPGSQFAELPAIAARIAATTDSDDRVFVFGAEPQVLFHARRVSATRYIHLFPLYGPYPGAHERQRGVAEEITRAAPAAILWIPNNLFLLPGSDAWLTHWVEAYLRSGHRADAVLSIDPSGATELRVGTDDRPATAPMGREATATLYVRTDD